MDFDYMFMPLKRYAEFDGRSRRKEFWMFFLLQVGIGIAFGILFLVAAQVSQTLGLLVQGVNGLVSLGLLIPGIAVSIRRLHDQDKSGWFILLAFIPCAGIFIMLFFMLQEGTPGRNQYGPDPKGAKGKKARRPDRDDSDDDEPADY
jgi:uncharacterized membrane protein YhaH (DUF805 family)